MSGGHFEYKQHQITDIASDIEAIILKNGVKVKDSHSDLDYYSDPDYIRYNFTPQTIERFKTVVDKLREIQQTVHDIDYLVSSDIGEDTFNKAYKDSAKDNLDKANSIIADTYFHMLDQIDLATYVINNNLIKKTES